MYCDKYIIDMKQNLFYIPEKQSYNDQYIFNGKYYCYKCFRSIYNGYYSKKFRTGTDI